MRKCNQLTEAVRQAKEHWRPVPKPMVHEATAEQKAEIHAVYEELQKTTDKAKRKKLREELEHHQQMIHDERRNKVCG